MDFLISLLKTRQFIYLSCSPLPIPYKPQTGSKYCICQLPRYSTCSSHLWQKSSGSIEQFCLNSLFTTSGGPHATANPSETHRKALGSFCMRAGKDRKLACVHRLGEKQWRRATRSSGELHLSYIRYTQFDKELLVLLLDSNLADQLSYSHMCLTHSQRLLNLCFFQHTAGWWHLEKTRGNFHKFKSDYSINA